MSLHKRIPLDYTIVEQNCSSTLSINWVLRRATQFATPRSLLSIQSWDFCRLLQKACTEEQHCMEGKELKES